MRSWLHEMTREYLSVLKGIKVCHFVVMIEVLIISAPGSGPHPVLAVKFEFQEKDRTGVIEVVFGDSVKEYGNVSSKDPLMEKKGNWKKTSHQELKGLNSFLLFFSKSIKQVTSIDDRRS